MTRQQIFDAYQQIQPTQAEKDRMLQTILSQASDLPPRGKDVPMKTRKRKPLLIAALVAVMLLLAGCAVAVALNLKELKMGEHSYTEPAHFDENGEKVAAENVTLDLVSLQGIAGTPSQQAAKEWLEFEQSYDPDGSLIAQADVSGYRAPEDYQAYFVYNQEMLDKVDEICQKYGLKLAGKQAVVQRYQSDVFYDALRIDSLLRPGAKAEVGEGSGYFYTCGNFQFAFDVTLTGGENQWKHPVWISMRYCDKEYLDTVYFAMEDVSAAQQWNYTLADGTQVLIVNTGEAARVFCDREDAFVSVRFETSYTNDNGTKETMSNRDIELTAEAIDFMVKPQKPDMAEVETKLEAAEKIHQAEIDAMMETWVDPYVHDGYQEYIANLLKDPENAKNMTYAIIDVNSNGVEELLLGDKRISDYEENSFINAITMKDGKTCFFFSTGHAMYVCEGNVLESNDIQQYGENHCYYTLGGDYDSKTMKLEKFVCVGYRQIDETWRMSTFSNVPDEVITEEEARQIMDSYIRIPVEMKPITEFPMN